MASMKNTKTCITNDTQKRLIYDIANIYKNPLNDEGIYYIHDDENILKGYAMIIGPKDTPYENGFYLFEFNFPQNYPLEPPKLVFLNNDGETRFNPNLYRNGKVCLSILNTWRGEGWTSCQTIRSVLLTLITILNDAPLVNEPGITEKHADFNKYNEILTYKNIEYSILEILSKCIFPRNCSVFNNVAKEHVINIKEKLVNKIQLLSIKYPDKTVIQTRIYDLYIRVNYPVLLKNVINLYDVLENNK